MTPLTNAVDRRTVLRGIGTGAAVLAGGVGVAGAADDTAQIRVTHLSPDAPAVDGELDGPVSTTVEGVSFGDVTGYLEVPPGEYTVSVPAAGASAEVSLEADEYSTGAAIGSLDGQGQSFRLAASEDNGGAVPGDSRVRLIHASPDAPTVAVTVEETGEVLYRNVGFGDSDGYRMVPAGITPSKSRSPRTDDPVAGRWPLRST